MSELLRGRIWVLAAMLTLTACENTFLDLDEIQVEAPSDMMVLPDAADGGIDGVDAALDAAVDMGFPDVNVGECNPVRQDCPAGEYCTLRIDDPMNPMELFTDCKSAAQEGTLGRDEMCLSANACTRDFRCVNWAPPDFRGSVCSRYCILATGEGCGSDEFCTNPFDILEGIGFCAPSCEPAANDCPADTQCHPDPSFLTGEAPRASLRCLAVEGDFSAKVEGSECDLANVNVDGCATGLLCHPTGGNDRCVKPCTADGDCTTSCAQPAEPYGVRFCKLS